MNKPSQPSKLPVTDPSSEVSPKPRTSLLQALLLSGVAVGLFFCLLEGGLALFGVQPVLQEKDPFVGFTTAVPLFVPTQNGMSTASNKLDYFNPQSFSKPKPPGTYRIFTLGGSTTYGRPYQDHTSFSGWLRELLPLADRNKNWEVINAGGISYASYRVAHLMEELVAYQPDLFIIYTGHNEFLEERTYRQLKQLPSQVRSLISLLAGTRTWSALQDGLQKIGVSPEAAAEQRTRLPGEVDAILEQSAGLDRYTRDDQLRDNVLEHFRLSLERMVELARSVNARVILVTPVSNLKNCSPFKSEHVETLTPAARQTADQMLLAARREIRQGNWAEALERLSITAALDPRHAEIQYQRGRALLALGHFEEAEQAFRTARDEDVCPLRALTPVSGIVRQVAAQQQTGLVDFVALLEQRMQAAWEHNILGKEFFLDHVHPTIDAHKLLAVALIDQLAEEGLVELAEDWGEPKITQVDELIRSRIDEETHALALANLARVFFWAKKTDDAERLALQALEMADTFDDAAINATSTLSTVLMQRGRTEAALDLLYAALEEVPDAVELRLQLGQFLLSPSLQELEKATANLLLITREMPEYDRAHALLGMVMAMRGRPRMAYPSLMEALRLNPNNLRAQALLTKLRPLLDGQKVEEQPASLVLETYPSRAPRRLLQVRRDGRGKQVVDGVQVEFFENGRIRLFSDHVMGTLLAEMAWDNEGHQAK